MNYPHITYSGIRNKPWVLTKDFKITLSNGDVAIIPAGYWTDLESIPLPLKVFFDHLGIGIQAFLIHDYMYNFGGYLTRKYKLRRITDQVTRKQADQEMYIQMRFLGENEFKAWLYYIAVRIGGIFSFRTI